MNLKLYFVSMVKETRKEVNLIHVSVIMKQKKKKRKDEGTILKLISCKFVKERMC